jgi:hypothetical protein
MPARTQLKTVITTMVLAIICWLYWQGKSIGSSGSTPRPFSKPLAPVRRRTVSIKMLDAARASDTKAYLDCFSGEMRLQLAEAIEETSATQFSKYLVAQNSAYTGVPVSITGNPTPNNARGPGPGPYS